MPPWDKAVILGHFVIHANICCILLYKFARILVACCRYATFVNIEIIALKCFLLSNKYNWFKCFYRVISIIDLNVLQSDKF